MDKENRTESNSESGVDWVLSQLSALSLPPPKALSGDDVATDLVSCIRSLLHERGVLRERATVLGEQCLLTQTEVGALERSHETVSAELEATKHELAYTNSKLSAMQTELRQARSQWAAEKTELEARNFQTLALQQSTLGSFRKKEKDFSNLQSQLMKHVRDAQKAQKGSIVVSKPLPPSWQERPERLTVRDAEIAGLQASLLATHVGRVGIYSLC